MTVETEARKVSTLAGYANRQSDRQFTGDLWVRVPPLQLSELFSEKPFDF